MLLLRTMATGDAVAGGLVLARTGTLFDPKNPTFENFTDAGTNTTYIVVPRCKPRSTYEQDCSDGIDDDCNGRVYKVCNPCNVAAIWFEIRESNLHARST